MVDISINSIACEPDMLQVSAMSHILDADQQILMQLAQIYSQELVGIIGWAKQIPGFCNLTLNDQIQLLQSTWIEILTLYIARRSIPSTGKLYFPQNFLLDERTARKCYCSELYFHCIQIADKIQQLHLVQEEYNILKALVLANSDVKLENPEALHRFRDSILNRLSDFVSVIRPGQVMRTTQNMFLVLPSLRQADVISRKFWFSVYRSGKISMNSLFVEMLGIMSQ